MAADTVTTLNLLLKNEYEPEFVKAFNEEAVGWGLANRQTRHYQGGSEIFGVQITRSGNPGVRAETQGIPTPQGPKPLQASVQPARIYKTFEISHDVVERSQEDDAAFREVLGLEIDTAFDRIKNYGNILFYGDGKAVLATVATAGGATLTGTIGNTQQITVDSTRYLSEGDTVAFWTSAAAATLLANGGQLPNAGTTPADESVQILSVDSPTLVTVKRIKTDGGSATIVAGNQIRLFGDSTTDATTRVDQAPNGLALFADDTTLATNFEGISRAAGSGYPKWRGQIIDATGGVGGTADLTRDHLYQLNDKIRRNSQYFADTGVWDPSARRGYLALVQPDIRFAPVKEIDAGYSTDDALESIIITLGQKKWRMVEDVFCPFGTIFAWPKSQLICMELSPLEMDKSTGSILKQGVPYGPSGVGDVFYGYLRWKGNFATAAASAFGKINNLSYSVE